MPELPEVEVTRRQIRRALVGRTVTLVETTRPSYFFLTRPAELRERLLGRRVDELERIGKYLLAHLDDSSRLLLHLGMTGQLFSAGAQSRRLTSARASVLAPEVQPAFVPDLHTHLVLGFSDPGPRVFFRDVRKFGKVLWIAPEKTHESLGKPGIDALRARGKHLWEAARRRKIPIKTVLLDQQVLAGVGNIYADEALFLAGVRSTRRSDRVTVEECEKIVEAVKDVLRRSITSGGSSVRDYVRPDGRDGGFQNEHYVYGRTGEPCLRCGTPIRRLVIGQRSAHFCPSCQK
jgi:formamidopyrimidine-DNA glycosylase